MGREGHLADHDVHWMTVATDIGERAGELGIGVQGRNLEGTSPIRQRPPDQPEQHGPDPPSRRPWRKHDPARQIVPSQPTRPSEERHLPQRLLLQQTVPHFVGGDGDRQSRQRTRIERRAGRADQ